MCEIKRTIGFNVMMFGSFFLSDAKKMKNFHQNTSSDLPDNSIVEHKKKIEVTLPYCGAVFSELMLATMERLQSSELLHQQFCIPLTSLFHSCTSILVFLWLWYHS